MYPVSVPPVIPYTVAIFRIDDPVIQPVVTVPVNMIVPVPVMAVMRSVFIPAVAVPGSIADNDGIVICCPARSSVAMPTPETAACNRYISIDGSTPGPAPDVCFR